MTESGGSRRQGQVQVQEQVQGQGQVQGQDQLEPMFFFSEPTSSIIAKFIDSQCNLPFTYAAVGATDVTPPPGFKIDHNRIQLGKGIEIFQRATGALKEWRQFDLGWASIVPEGVALEVGSTVAVKVRALGSWSLSATRVVYVIDDPGSRFGFAYGTLPDHVECGEERFTIELNEEDGSVWYDILAFSKPHHPLVRLSFPLARLLQKRFAQQSLRRMVAEVSAANSFC